MKMRSLSILAVTILLAPAGGSLRYAVAQELATQPQAAAPTTEPAYILAEFTQSLNGKKLKPGDRIKAEVSQDVLWHGRIVIPVESKLLGYVTEVKTRDSDSQSRLGIVFDKVVLKHHDELAVQGVVHALSAPAPTRSRVDEPDQMFPPSLGQSGMRNIPSASTGGMSGSAPISNSSRVPPASSSSGPLTAPIIAGNSHGTIPSPILETRSSENKSGHMSVGMPHGVFGLKGLSLTTGTSPSTPGPVIVSTGQDVKLEFGTQVLVKVAGIPSR
jgi:hypothetical protein